MVDAVSRAANVPLAEVRRAAMLAGDLGSVAAAAIEGGSAALARFRLSPLTPLQPMLAQSADDVAAAFERIRPAAVEWKLDGARIQIHRLGDEVRVFTRNLADVTDRVPEIVEAIRRLPLDAAVFDAEAIALRADGRPHPFGLTMSRFGSRSRGDLDELRADYPLSAFVFDVLHLDGDDLIDRPGTERFAALDERLPEELRVTRIVTDDPAEAERFLDDALDRGHEGVMVKALDAPYEAGRRGASWIKVKRASTLDLVVIAAEWGHGRRQGWLSNLHLGARDPETGGFVMLGKTFKGMTDEMLAWQTERLQEIETSRRRHHRARSPRARRRDRVRRPATEHALSGRAGSAVRAREGLPARQASRRRRHDRDGPRHPRAIGELTMPKLSAGLLVYRRRDRGLEVLLVHPGGPYWAKKDDGAWSTPQG